MTCCSRSVIYSFTTFDIDADGRTRLGRPIVHQGKQFEFAMPYTSYIMENVLFKISYPAEFHAQTAVEAAHILHNKLKSMGKSSDDIKSISIRTQEAAMRIINKKGPLDNFADREYVAFLHYYVYVGLLTAFS